MPDSVYKIITLIGTSTESWEKDGKRQQQQPLNEPQNRCVTFGLLRSKSWI